MSAVPGRLRDRTWLGVVRTLDPEERGMTEEYGEIFSDIRTIGFSTYGEGYLGHINQTSTILVLK